MEFGVNLNNREPLITSDYTLADVLDLAELAEQRGFGSVWVGDSLFSKPRYEPISLLSEISQRTSRAKLGTACLVTSTRNPLYLALEWATLDQLSGGRTVLGACMGNPDHGEYFDFDDVSFHSGTEMGPLMPVQQPPPTWVVSNIRLTGDLAPEVAKKRMRDACARVIKYGDGWMTCCRAMHPEEVAEQISALRKAAADLGEDFSRYTVSYQVTMNIGDSTEQATRAFGEYISSYYPELSKSVDLSNWGPTGTPETVADWFRRFSAAGVDHFVCRFGALDQFGQVERFAADVLPALEEKGSPQ